MYYRKIEVTSNYDYYNNHPSYTLYYDKKDYKVYFFATSDEMSGAPLTETEEREFDKVRKNMNHLPLMFEYNEDESEEEIDEIEAFKQKKRMFDMMKEAGLLKNADSYFSYGAKRYEPKK